MPTKRKIAILAATIISVSFLTWAFIRVGDSYFPVEQSPTKEEQVMIAENWIRNFSSSHPVYGRDLELKEKKKLDNEHYRFEFLSLVENHRYGEWESRIIIEVDGTEVVSVIRDDVFNEMEGKPLTEEKEVEVFLISKDKEIESEEITISHSLNEEFWRVVFKELLELSKKEEYFSLFEKRDINYLSEEEGELLLSIEKTMKRDEFDLLEEQIKETMEVLDEVESISLKVEEIVEPVDIEGIPGDFRFEEEMERGSRGEEVRYLQILLNENPETMVSEFGAGSPGSETEYFGPSLRDAVIAFQEKFTEEIDDDPGYVGEDTLEKLNEILGKGFSG